MRFLIDTAYDRASWHGPNLLGALTGLSLREACWRPAPGRHNIWELVVHAAYWKYVAWRRLTGGPRGAFPLKGSNWWPRPVSATAAAWREDLALLDAMHRLVRDAADAVPLRRLDQRAPIGTATHRALLAGIAAHDVYHAGQIRLLRRLASGARASRR
jgi:uncharacterized damage-inducible protein DinB